MALLPCDAKQGPDETISSTSTSKTALWVSKEEIYKMTDDELIHEVLLTSEREKHQQVLIEWNATRTDYPQNICIHALFETQVERTPAALAIVCEDKRLTYQELNCQA